LVGLDHILPLSIVRADQTDHIQIIGASVVDIVAEVRLEIADCIPLLHYHRRNEVQVSGCHRGERNSELEVEVVKVERM